MIIGFAKGLLAKVALFAGGWSVRDGNQFPDLDVEHHPTIPEMNGYFVGRPKNWKDYYELAAIIRNTTSIMKTCLKSLLVKDRMEMWGPRWDTT